MTTFTQADLVAAAGVDPWKLLAQLKAGDPAQIDALAAAFYKAGGDMADAHSATVSSQKYVTQGYQTQGSSPLDFSAEAAHTKATIAGGAAHLPAIAKILTAVGSDLGTATTKSASEVSALESRINALSAQWTTFMQGIGHHLPEDDQETERTYLVNEAVAAVKSHGSTVNTYLTGYESTLASSLRSMADLGYIPPDPVDEGPGDVNLNNPDGDAQTTIDATTNPNRKAGLAQYDQGTEAVDLINRATKANGGKINDADYHYLWEYYNKTAPHAAAINTLLTGPDADRAHRGAVYADGLLNLTNGADQTTDNGVPPDACGGPNGMTVGRGGYGGLPPSVTAIVNSDIGKVQLTPQDASNADDVKNSPLLRRAEWVDGHWVVDNYATDTGFASLLSSADPGVQGSNDFSTNLAQAGIRWKQDISAVQTNTSNWLGAVHSEWNGGEIDGPTKDEAALGFPPDLHNADPNNLHLGLNDNGASAALSTASHNSYASAAVLNDATDRHAILGLKWDNGNGAAQLITSGTAPDPTNSQLDPNHPGESIRNEAALNVIKDTGSDYQTLAAGLSTPVKNALTNLGITHLASFATPPSGSNLVTQIEIPGGGKIDGVQLDQNTSGNFLKMIGMLGPQQYGALHAAALEQGAQWIHAVPNDGSVTPDNSGAAYASNLDSRITAAGFAAASETASRHAGADHDAYTAELVQQQDDATHDLLGNIAFQTVDAGLSIATLGASDHVGKALDSLAALNGIASNARDDYNDYNSSNADSPYIQHLQAQVKTALDQPQDQAQVGVATSQDQSWMAIRAAALSPSHTVVVNGQPVDVSGVIDANGRPYLPPGQLVSGGAGASPSINVNDPHYQNATSNVTYHDVTAPLLDHTYGANQDKWATQGFNDTVSSTEGTGPSWAPSALTTTGDNKIVYWTMARDPNLALAGFEDPHDATPK